MKINWKQIGLVAVFLIVTALLGYALYYVFFKPKAPTVVVTPPAGFPGGLPPAGTGAPQPPTPTVPPSVLPPSPGIYVPPTPTVSVTPITSQATGGKVSANRLVDANAQYVNLASNGSSLNYYDSATGLFNKLNSDGTTSLLSTQIFKDVKNVTWAPTTDKAVLEFPDDTKIIYNFATKQSYSLPKQFTDFSFSPDSKQLAAKDLKTNPEDRWLVVVDDQGKNKELLEHLGDNENRVKVQWNPGGTIVATSAKSIDNERAEVIFLTKDGSKPNKLLVQGRDLRYEYSSDGNSMVYSVWNQASNYQPTLWITSSNPQFADQGRINTGLNTWADKCTFQENVAIYCAVPKALPELSGIDPTNNTSDDNIYRIDPATGQSTLIAQPIIPVQIKNVSVSKDGKSLYYTNQETGSINKIDL